MKVLVVDDEPLVRRTLLRAFSARKHDVYEAASGTDGLEIWQRVRPDLVFLDVLMPGMTGPQVLSQVRAWSQAKVILISAYSGEYDTERVQGLGADYFVAKPFEDIFTLVEFSEKLVS